MMILSAFHHGKTFLLVPLPSWTACIMKMLIYFLVFRRASLHFFIFYNISIVYYAQGVPKECATTFRPHVIQQPIHSVFDRKAASTSQPSLVPPKRPIAI
jgi:hypothetical protein